MQFPNGAHDDQVDAMTQALLWFNPRDESLCAVGERVQISPI